MEESLSSSSPSTAMLCCDPNGQAIGVKNSSMNVIDPNQSGTYTSIMRLASQLDAFSITSQSRQGQGQGHGQSSSSVAHDNSSRINDKNDVNTTDTTKLSNTKSSNTSSSITNNVGSSTTRSNNNSNHNNNSIGKPPMISIETDQSVTLIKAYGDHTVVMKMLASSTITDYTDGSTDAHATLRPVGIMDDPNINNMMNDDTEGMNADAGNTVMLDHTTNAIGGTRTAFNDEDSDINIGDNFATADNNIMNVAAVVGES